MRALKGPIALLTLTLLSGCSWFGDDDEEINLPTPLNSIEQEVNLERLWDVKIGRGAEDKAIKLVPGFSASRVYAAAADGTVKCLDSATGRVIWTINIEDFYSEEEAKNSFSDSADTITGGVGVGEDLVLVGSSAGEIVAMNQSDGSLAWRATTTSEVLAPPQAAQGIVAAQSIDGKVAGFDPLDGTRRWIYSASIPSLTLRGTSTPIISDLVFVGFSNGRVAALDREQGLGLIDQRVAAAQGKSDLERLVDIDGTMVMQGPMLYVVSYQGNLVAMDIAARGQVRWGKEASSVAGLGVGFGNVYLSSADSEVIAYSADRGTEVWKSEALKYRDITAPVAVSSYIAVADFDGYLHLMAQSDGRFVARRQIDGSGVNSPVVADGSRMYVMGNSGRLMALELQ